jgi:hypothetical protein
LPVHSLVVGPGGYLAAGTGGGTVLLIRPDALIGK